ncbi:hypothetical protein ID866_7748 [Astraeus odoratus]|nr:hypothetical protein ID866_7748 [Astraeus odoratus]
MLGQSASPWFKASRLEILITNACDPSIHEPNYAHHLEIAEHINTRKANTPREAAMLIARLANHRNPHIALLALSLLDTLVQSCGYPFHLQIATKDFLNELTLKTAEELENEDREAQSAKLQELIRRGTPRDLAAAQELMKSLAGANPDTKPDYRAQSLTELAKLQSKVILLNEMLDNVDAEGREKFAKGDAYDQVASILKSARPKLQKWVSDAESDDPESLNAFLEANDQINTALARFEAFQRGDYATVSSIPTSIGSTPGSGDNTGLSLIDLDDGSTTSGINGGRSTVDDLASLFGSSMPLTQAQPPPVNNATRPTISSPIPVSAQTQSQGQQFGSIMLPGTPTPSSPSKGNVRPRTTSPIGSSSLPPVGMGLSSIILAQSPPQTNNTGMTGAGMTHFMKSRSEFRPSSTGTQLGQQNPLQPSLAPQSQPAGTQNRDPFADLAGLF